MATRSKPELKVPEREDAELEEVMAKSNAMVDSEVMLSEDEEQELKALLGEDAGTAIMYDPTVVVVKAKHEESHEPMVMVNIPELPGSGSDGLKVDQYEHVTLANEHGEKLYKVKRGEPVMVPVSVFVHLKARYPKL